MKYEKLVEWAEQIDRLHSKAETLEEVDDESYLQAKKAAIVAEDRLVAEMFPELGTLERGLEHSEINSEYDTIREAVTSNYEVNV
jgi:hypothetical protein